MRKTIITMMLLAVGLTAVAQETHYHRALRGQDSDYGIAVSSDTYMGGITPGMYWTRTRDINDVAIVDATPEDSIARHAEFMRHYNSAFEAYVAGDAPRTLLYGDSALQTRLQAADLIFYMAISFERLGLYQKTSRLCAFARQRRKDEKFFTSCLCAFAYTRRKSGRDFFMRGRDFFKNGRDFFVGGRDFSTIIGLFQEKCVLLHKIYA